MKKLVLIEPKAPNLHIFSGMSLPRLGSILLGTLANEMGWDVQVVIEEQHNIEWDEIASSTLVGISTITPTAPRAFAIADRVRELNIPVIMGGPHVTFLPDEALEHSDFVIRGEGEIAFQKFLEVIETKGNFNKVPNLSWKDGDTIIHNEKAESCTDLDTLPFPDYSLVKGKTLFMAGKRILPLQTSRGCPFDCSFCSVTGMFGRKYRYRSTENILAEMRLHNKKRNYFFIYDDNFMANPRRARELLKAMAQEKFKFKWSTQVRTDVAQNPDLIELMKKAGCHTVFIGFESVNPHSLKSIQKKQSVEDMNLAARTFRKAGINVHGMFILGLDDDKPSTVRETIRFAKKNLISSAQFLILAPLPGTRQYDSLKSEGRILFTDWSLYDAHHVVYDPKNFTMVALQKAQILTHKKFYSLRETVRRLLHWKWGDIAIAFYARNLNRNWKRNNKTYMKLIKLLKPEKDTQILADFRQLIHLNQRVNQG